MFAIIVSMAGGGSSIPVQKKHGLLKGKKTHWGTKRKGITHDANKKTKQAHHFHTTENNFLSFHTACASAASSYLT